MLLGKIGQGIAQDRGQEPRAKTVRGKTELAIVVRLKLDITNHSQQKTTKLQLSGFC